jgi:hypothetical protein
MDLAAADVDWRLPVAVHIQCIVHGDNNSTVTSWHHLVPILNITHRGIPLVVRVARLHSLYAVHRHLRGNQTPWILCAVDADQALVVDRLVQAYRHLIANPSSASMDFDPTQWQLQTQTACGDAQCPMRGLNRIASTANPLTKTICMHEMLRCAACHGALWMGRTRQTRALACGRYTCSTCRATLCVQCWAQQAHSCAVSSDPAKLVLRMPPLTLPPPAVQLPCFTLLQ